MTGAAEIGIGLDGLAWHRAAVFFGLLAVFAWPGVRAVSLWDREQRFSASGRAALGWVVAFGVFSGLVGPLLLRHSSTRTALLVVSIAWGLAFVAVEILGRLRPRRHVGAREREPGETSWIAPTGAWGRGVGLLLVGSLLTAWALATEVVPHRAALGSGVLLFAANAGMAWLAWTGRMPFRPVSREALGRLPALASLAAAALGLFAVVSATVYVRPDLDDTLYLSEALLLVDAPAMGAEAPTQRGESLPPTPFYEWQAFELWGALLSRLAGIHPLISFRTLFAPVLALLVVALWAEVLRRLVPAGTLPIALLVLLAYWTIGISSHWTASNYLLPRPAQGKTWLMHAAIPALLLLNERLVHAPRASSWLFLLAGSLAALGFAPTAVYLVPALLGPLCVAHLLVKPERRTLVAALLTILAVLPQVGFGAHVWALQSDVLRTEALDWGEHHGNWWDSLFFFHLNFKEGGGALEFFSLLACPLLALFRRDRASQTYPLLFTLLFLAAFTNPVVYPSLIELMDASGYQRLFWLIPFGPILAILGASATAMLCGRGRRVVFATPVLGLMLLAMPLVGGRYVWGEANPTLAPESLTPHLAENAYKMPDELLAMGRYIGEVTPGPQAHILCSERIASHLAPLDPDFGFVFTRGYQTRVPLLMVGRAEEADRRERLARDFLAGVVPEEEATELLRSSRAAFVLLEGESPAVVRPLQRAGFVEAKRSTRYSLWVRQDIPVFRGRSTP